MPVSAQCGGGVSKIQLPTLIRPNATNPASPNGPPHLRSGNGPKISSCPRHTFRCSGPKRVGCCWLFPAVGVAARSDAFQELGRVRAKTARVFWGAALSEQSRHSIAMTARNTSASPTLYFFDIVEDYPEIGGVARVSARLRCALRQHFGARLVAVRDIADGLGCGDKGEDYLARERRAMLRLAQIDPASTFFIPNFQNPLDRVADLIRPKIVNIVHDLQFACLPDLFTAEQHRWLDAAFSATRANADAIAFVSRTTRDHFVARYGAPAQCRVIAAPIGATTPGRAVAGRPPFLLAVQHGECHPHKNVAGLLRLFAGLAERSPALTLLVTGRGRASFETECESLPRHVRDRVHHLGHVARDELNGLYRGAEAFVSLSRFEGFNMPAAEAASCGTPLILSDLPVHREFHTDAACFLDPDEAGRRRGCRVPGRCRASPARLCLGPRRPLFGRIRRPGAYRIDRGHRDRSCRSHAAARGSAPDLGHHPRVPGRHRPAPVRARGATPHSGGCEPPKTRPRAAGRHHPGRLGGTDAGRLGVARESANGHPSGLFTRSQQRLRRRRGQRTRQHSWSGDRCRRPRRLRDGKFERNRRGRLFCQRLLWRWRGRCWW